MLGRPEGQERSLDRHGVPHYVLANARMMRQIEAVRRTVEVQPNLIRSSSVDQTDR